MDIPIWAWIVILTVGALIISGILAFLFPPTVTRKKARVIAKREEYRWSPGDGQAGGNAIPLYRITFEFEDGQQVEYEVPDVFLGATIAIGDTGEVLIRQVMGSCWVAGFEHQTQ